MDRRRAAGALLALAACIACSSAAPMASNQTALELLDSPTEGCYYNFQHYGEGDRIMTNEPCLNCTCHNRMLMCYLRVCPFTKPIGQDCTIEKRADQCCPIVTCPDVPVDLLTSTSTSSPAEYGATGLGKVDKYGCSINGKYFAEGSKVPPSPNKPCEHCYCIRNMTTCVMQECTLHVDGCTPIYHKDVCCPVRYSCDHPEDEVLLLDDMTTTVRPTPGFLLTTTTMAAVTQISQDCVHDDQIFSDGALIKTEKACEHCYCMKGDIVCVVQECGTPMENEGKNCTSLPPRQGQCCPDTYICEGDEITNEASTGIAFDDLTTLSPPRRVEGSGYRLEPDEPYTEIPAFEGSGEEQTTTLESSDISTPQKQTPELIDEVFAVTEEAMHSSISTTEPDKSQNTVPDELQESIESKPTIPQETDTVTQSTITSDLNESDNMGAISTVSDYYSTSRTDDLISKEDEIAITTQPTPKVDIEVTEKIESQPEVEKETTVFINEIEIEATTQSYSEASSPESGIFQEENKDKLTTLQLSEYTTKTDETSPFKEITTEFPIQEVQDETTKDEKQDHGASLTTNEDTDLLTTATDKIESSETTSVNPIENEIDEDTSSISSPGRIPGEGDCLLNSITYKNNTSVPNINNCHSGCRCVSSIVKCDPIICSPPPEHMDNLNDCQPIYDTPDACCPTYVCHSRETIPPESHNQMSGTESPKLSPEKPAVECHDDQCKAQETIPTTSEICSSGNCIPESEGQIEKCKDGDCIDHSQTSPTKSPSLHYPEGCVGDKCQTSEESCTDGKCKQPVTSEHICNSENGCQPSEAESCVGKNCETRPEVTASKDERICENGEECKTGDGHEIVKPACDGEASCDSSIPSEDTVPVECTGEGCIPKERPQLEPAECSGSDCITQDTVTINSNILVTEPTVPSKEQLPKEPVTEATLGDYTSQSISTDKQDDSFVTISDTTFSELVTQESPDEQGTKSDEMVTQKEEPSPEAFTEKLETSAEVFTEKQKPSSEIFTESHESSPETFTEKQVSSPDVFTEKQEISSDAVTENQEYYPEVFTEKQEASPDVVTEQQETSPEVFTEKMETAEITEKQEISPDVVTEQQEISPEVLTEKQETAGITEKQEVSSDFVTVQQETSPEGITEKEEALSEFSTEKQEVSPDVITDKEEKSPEVFTETLDISEVTEKQETLPELSTETQEVEQKTSSPDVITEKQETSPESYTEKLENSEVTKKQETMPEIFTEKDITLTEFVTEKQEASSELYTDKHETTPEMFTENAIITEDVEHTATEKIVSYAESTQQQITKLDDIATETYDEQKHQPSPTIFLESSTGPTTEKESDEVIHEQETTGPPKETYTSEQKFDDKFTEVSPSASSIPLEIATTEANDQDKDEIYGTHVTDSSDVTKLHEVQTDSPYVTKSKEPETYIPEEAYTEKQEIFTESPEIQTTYLIDIITPITEKATPSITESKKPEHTETESTITESAVSHTTVFDKINLEEEDEHSTAEYPSEPVNNASEYPETFTTEQPPYSKEPSYDHVTGTKETATNKIFDDITDKQNIPTDSPTIVTDKVDYGTTPSETEHVTQSEKDHESTQIIDEQISQETPDTESNKKPEPTIESEQQYTKTPETVTDKQYDHTSQEENLKETDMTLPNNLETSATEPAVIDEKQEIFTPGVDSIEQDGANFSESPIDELDVLSTALPEIFEQKQSSTSAPQDEPTTYEAIISEKVEESATPAQSSETTTDGIKEISTKQPESITVLEEDKKHTIQPEILDTETEKSTSTPILDKLDINEQTKIPLITTDSDQEFSTKGETDTEFDKASTSAPEILSTRSDETFIPSKDSGDTTPDLLVTREEYSDLTTTEISKQTDIDDVHKVYTEVISSEKDRDSTEATLIPVSEGEESQQETGYLSTNDYAQQSPSITTSVPFVTDNQLPEKQETELPKEVVTESIENEIVTEADVVTHSPKYPVTEGLEFQTKDINEPEAITQAQSIELGHVTELQGEKEIVTTTRVSTFEQDKEQTESPMSLVTEIGETHSVQPHDMHTLESELSSSNTDKTTEAIPSYIPEEEKLVTGLPESTNVELNKPTESSQQHIPDVDSISKTPLTEEDHILEKSSTTVTFEYTTVKPSETLDEEKLNTERNELDKSTKFPEYLVPTADTEQMTTLLPYPAETESEAQTIDEDSNDISPTIISTEKSITNDEQEYITKQPVPESSGMHEYDSSTQHNILTQGDVTTGQPQDGAEFSTDDSKLLPEPVEGTTEDTRVTEDESLQKEQDAKVTTSAVAEDEHTLTPNVSTEKQPEILVSGEEQTPEKPKPIEQENSITEEHTPILPISPETEGEDTTTSDQKEEVTDIPQVFDAEKEVSTIHEHESMADVPISHVTISDSITTIIPIKEQDTSTDSIPTKLPEQFKPETPEDSFNDEITTELSEKIFTDVQELGQKPSDITEEIATSKPVESTASTVPELNVDLEPDHELHVSHTTESEALLETDTVTSQEDLNKPIVTEAELHTTDLEDIAVKPLYTTNEYLQTTLPESHVTEKAETITDSKTTDLEGTPVETAPTRSPAQETETATDEKFLESQTSETPNIPEGIPQTLEPKYPSSETTPYLVELEEHTNKIEDESSTVIPTKEQITSRPEMFEGERGDQPFDITTDKTQEEVIHVEQTTKDILTETEHKSTTSQQVETTEYPKTTDLDEEIPHKTEVTTEGALLVPSEVPVDTLPSTQITEDIHTISTDTKDDSTLPPSTSISSSEQSKLTTESSETETITDKKELISGSEITQEPQVTPEISSPEDELIPAITKTTTASAPAEITTSSPDEHDKYMQPEEKPIEPYLPTASPELPKPGISEMQPTEEISQPDFPPSGTTGYGQEPDYVEEDQAFGPGTCRYGGKVYVSAQQIPRDDPCDFCFCFRSDIICLQQSCPPPIHGCHEEPIQGFCCPRYECPVSMATTLNVTTTTTTTTTTLPPHFLPHAYKGAAQRRGCQIKGHTYKVGEVVRASSGPCLHCTCGGDGQMKCDPKACTPEPMLRQMIAAAVSAKRRR